MTNRPTSHTTFMDKKVQTKATQEMLGKLVPSLQKEQ